MTKPLPKVTPNTWEFLRDPMIAPTGFREYDARWQYPEAINLPGITALGLGLGTQMQQRGIEPVIAVGNDYRDYSLSIKNALILGLMQAGIHVKDIGPCLSPMAYFAQFHLDAPAVAMVTASHNPNGWTGVKMGFERPLTHGPDEMAELRDIVLEGRGERRDGGKYEFVDGVREAYLDDLGWVGFDVSNGVAPDEKYVRIAIGRDASDAAPVSGMRLGTSEEAMIVSLQVQQ